MSSLIKLQQISKTYQRGEHLSTVLENVDLEVTQGEFIAIMGASGSGKSTLLNLIGLLDRPTAGKYYLDQQLVSTFSDDQRADLRNHKIGFVFQSFFLLPRLTAKQNISLPLTYRRHLSAAEVEARVITMLQKVGMGEKTHHKPSELSGGQQQRVAIARALVGDPELILADEPTGALDTITAQEIMALFKQFNQEANVTIMIITHDPQVAAQCHRVVRIEDGHIT